MVRLRLPAVSRLTRLRPWQVGALAAVLWAALLGVVALGSYGGDPRAFVCLGHRLPHPTALADVPRTSEYGYDGQYYAALALDPLLRHSETVASLDAPFYRAGRIGVPLAAWALAWGHPTVALVFYQLLCWGGGLAAILLVARWLAAERRPAAWALLLAISAGLAVSMFRSTPDGAAVALIVAALWCNRQGRTSATVLALAAAALTRETSFLVAIAVAFVELRDRRWRAAIATLAAPLVALGAWQAYLHLHLSGIVSDRGIGVFGLPFAWGPRKLARLGETGLTAGRMELLGLLALVACFAALALVATRFRRWSAAEASFVAFGLLAVALGYPAYVEVYAYTRVLLALPFLALLIVRPEDGRLASRVLAAVPILLAVTGLVVVRGELGLATVRSALGAVTGRSVALPAAPSPPATAMPAPTAAPTPVPAPPDLYLLPAARTAGHFGAQWRTELVLENLGETPATVTLELLPGAGVSAPPGKEITLAAHEKRRYADALGELFGAEGSGALRVIRQRAGVVGRLRTFDSASKGPRGRFLEGVEATAAFGRGRDATLAGLAHEPSGKSHKRTNVGLLNLSGSLLDIELEVRGHDGRALGSKRALLRGNEFRQVNDIFGLVGIKTAAAGSVRITARTATAAYLAYASVVRRDPPSVTYVMPAQL